MGEMRIGRVIVGIDESLAGYQALRYAVLNARQCERPWKRTALTCDERVGRFDTAREAEGRFKTLRLL